LLASISNGLAIPNALYSLLNLSKKCYGLPFDPKIQTQKEDYPERGNTYLGVLGITVSFSGK
jgi:hypothetical protein